VGLLGYTVSALQGKELKIFYCFKYLCGQHNIVVGNITLCHKQHAAHELQVECGSFRLHPLNEF